MDACEVMGERLSADRDGELLDAERTELQQHLRGCSACRRRAERFAAVDRALSANELAPSDGFERRLARAVPPAGRAAAWPRLVRVAAAAVVLLAVGMLVLVASDRADAGRIAAPIATIELLQRQAADDQRALLRTMEWELRALRLELGQLGLDDESRSPVLSRIDRLLEHVRAPNALDGTDGIEGDRR